MQMRLSDFIIKRLVFGALVAASLLAVGPVNADVILAHRTVHGSECQAASGDLDARLYRNQYGIYNNDGLFNTPVFCPVGYDGETTKGDYSRVYANVYDRNSSVAMTVEYCMVDAAGGSLLCDSANTSQDGFSLVQLDIDPNGGAGVNFRYVKATLPPKSGSNVSHLVSLDIYELDR